MASVNQVIILGNLGKDPELKHTQTGKSVATFSVATTDKWKDNNGQWHEKTEWHNIVVWGAKADNCAQYLSKGSSVYIDGKISTRTWDDRDGNKKYKTEIIANEVLFLNKKSGGGQSNNQKPAPASDGFDVPIDYGMPF